MFEGYGPDVGQFAGDESWEALQTGPLHSPLYPSLRPPFHRISKQQTERTHAITTPHALKEHGEQKKKKREQHKHALDINFDWTPTSTRPRLPRLDYEPRPDFEPRLDCEPRLDFERRLVFEPRLDVSSVPTVIAV